MPNTVGGAELLWIVVSFIGLCITVVLSRSAYIGWRRVNNPCDEKKRPGIGEYSLGRIFVFVLFTTCEIAFVYAGYIGATLPEPVTEALIEGRETQALSIILGNIFLTLGILLNFWIHSRIPRTNNT